MLASHYANTDRSLKPRHLLRRLMMVAEASLDVVDHRVSLSWLAASAELNTECLVHYACLIILSGQASIHAMTMPRMDLMPVLCAVSNPCCALNGSTLSIFVYRYSFQPLR